ncbi:MAG: FmdB family zinc ribbon protein [Terracidiphilus sp.]
MPLYAYRCTQCGHRFEKIQHFSSDPELECPKCHGLLERPLTAPRLHFKGAGWYVNDYPSQSSAPASDSGSESGKSAATAKSKPSTNSGESKSSTPAAAPPSSSAPTSGTTDSKS